MYAILKSGGKQYRVSKGDLIRVEKIEGEVGDRVEFPVLLLREGEELKVGNPFLEGVKVIGRIARQGKGEKILIFKYKRRKNYRRKQGHRQHYTWVQIVEIEGVKGDGA